MTKGWIYIIRNIINRKVYIGQTHMGVKIRFQDHLSAARHGKDYVIGKAIRKYGEENFYVDILDECFADDEKELTKLLNAKETFWISFFNSTNSKFGYNMSIGGNVVRTTKELDENQVIDMFNSGIGAYNIAKILHVHPYKTAEILKKHHIIYGKDKQRVPVEKEIIESYLLGKGTMDISRKFKVNKSTVRRVLLRNNIKLRHCSKNKNSERNPQTLIIK